MWRDATHQPLRLFDQLVQLRGWSRTLSRLNFSKNSSRLVTAESRKTRRLAVAAAQPLGQVRHQLGELAQERLLGQFNRLLEAAREPLLLFLVEIRVEPQ